MEIFEITSREIKENKELLEEKLHVKIKIKSKSIEIEGEAIKEYEASMVLDAINFGFSAKTALLLIEEDMIFRKIGIKSVTRRKNVSIIKSRLIGTQGKTKHTLENLADARIIIKDNQVGVIGPAEEMEDIVTSIESLIRGSKQSNVYKYLEKRNRERKEQKYQK